MIESRHFGRDRFIASAVVLVAAIPSGCGSVPAVPRDCFTYWLLDQQSDEGWWTSEVDRAEPSVRVTALAVLERFSVGLDAEAFVDANPSCGGQRPRLRECISRALHWLIDIQEPPGWFRCNRRGADRAWLVDHVMATCAMTEAMRFMHASVPPHCVENAIRRLETSLAGRLYRAESDPPDPELWLWCEWLARSLRSEERVSPSYVSAELAGALSATVAEMARRSRIELRSDELSDRGKSALSLYNSLTEREHEPPPDDWVRDPLRDPLLTLYSLCYLWRESAPGFVESSEAVSKWILAAEFRTASSAGYWASVGDPIMTDGAEGTSAVAAMILTVCFRWNPLFPMLCFD